MQQLGTYGVLAVMLVVSLAGVATPAHAADINGGLSWGGWTSQGLSDQLGVYGSGSTTDVYEVYTTVFNFNNDSVSGGAVGGGPTGGATGFGTGAFSAGAFVNGNTILGVGVRRVSGSSLTNFTPTVRFDLDTDSYQTASSVGGGDGRTSFSTYSEQRDFTIQFEGSAGWRGGSINMQAGNGNFYGGPNNTQSIVGGIGSGVSYDWPFRAFAQPDSYQMFFDLNAMQAIYGTGNPNPFGLNANFTGIGVIGSPVRISLNGLGSNNVVFDAGVPTGACCTDGPGTESVCIEIDQATCEAMGGLFLGAGTICADVLDCVPLFVTMESVSAVAVRGGAAGESVLVSWTTATELDTIGFRVLRELPGPDGREKRLQVAASMIPSAGHGLAGATYQFLDDSRQAAHAVHYYIEDIDIFGRVTRHGPFSVDRGSRQGPRAAPRR